MQIGRKRRGRGNRGVWLVLTYEGEKLETKDAPLEAPPFLPSLFSLKLHHFRLSIAAFSFRCCFRRRRWRFWMSIRYSVTGRKESWVDANCNKREEEEPREWHFLFRTGTSLMIDPAFFRLFSGTLYLWVGHLHSFNEAHFPQVVLNILKRYRRRQST